MQNILIVSTFYPPLNTAGSLRPYSWAKYWTREGHAVTVLTTPKLAPSAALEVADPGCVVREIPLPGAVQRLKRMHARLVHETGNAASQRSGSAGWLRRAARSVDEWRTRAGVLGAGPRMPGVSDSWAFPALRAASEGRPWDLVVTTAAPYFVHFVGYGLKRRGFARRWIADYRDLWTSHQAARGVPVVRTWESWLERRLLRSADVVTTVSEPLAAILREAHGARKVQVIENGVDPTDYDALDPAPAFAPDGKVRIVYTGTVYEAQDPSPLFEGIADLARDRTAAPLLHGLEVVFATPSVARVTELARRARVTKWVRVLGLVPRPLALRMQRDADFLLFLPWKHDAFDGILTSKVYEYLFSGLPILLVGHPILEAAQRLVLEFGVGVRLPAMRDVRMFLSSRLRDATPRVVRRPSATMLSRYERRDLALRLLALASTNRR